MSAFEFFFSFYGLLLGLSVAVIATGLATAIQHRKKIRIGWLTPLLALFVGLDIASFWDSAWVNFRHLPFSYGLLVAGLAVALVYFIAASLVFPHDLDDGQSLDDHFWANKKVVLLLTVAANLVAYAVIAAANLGRDNGAVIVLGYLPGVALYAGLVIPAALARKQTLFVTLIGIHIAVYLLIAVMSAALPDLMAASGYAETPAPATAPAGKGAVVSAFEFFFSFYGLLLGLSVAELVGGFSRLLHERHRVRFGWLTPLLALFVALDLATFWNQAWRFFRGAPFNPALLLVGLVIAATFYIAASVTFPRVTAEGVETRIDLDEHFWAHRRVVFACVLAANAMVWLLLGALALADPAWAAVWSPRLVIGVAIFAVGTAAAAFAPRRGLVVAALIVLLVYTLWNMVRAGLSLIAAGAWSPAT